ncbi:hypothetical protein [Caballeronia sp. KNU42]
MSVGDQYRKRFFRIGENTVLETVRRYRRSRAILRSDERGGVVKTLLQRKRLPQDCSGAFTQNTRAIEQLLWLDPFFRIDTRAGIARLCEGQRRDQRGFRAVAVGLVV